jgi:hypothetical protein
MTAFDWDNLQLIFSALVDWWLRKFSYSQNISKLAKGLVGAGQGVMLLLLLLLLLCKPSAVPGPMQLVVYCVAMSALRSTFACQTAAASSA